MGLTYRSKEGKIMKLPAASDKLMEMGTIRDMKMQSSIVDSMNRYFQNDSGKPRQDLESAIMNSVKRYFEGPSRDGI
jgi:hypothetical protein